jgi:hypothetical protein
MTTSTTIDDNTPLGTVLNGAGETKLTSLIIKAAGTQLHPGFDPITGKVNSGYFQIRDGRGRFMAIDASSGCNSFVGGPLSLVGNLF